jgi:hypothetical protein
MKGGFSMCQNFLIDRLTHAAISVLRFALFVLLFPSFGWTDDWPGAMPFQVFSKSAKYFVRVIPGESIGDTIGFAGARKGKFAQALYYALQADRSYKLLHEIGLQNPVAPVDLLLSDRGYFIAFDNWHNLGFGKVVAIYAPTGKLSFTWPRSMAQLPINVGDATYDPLFPYGFGLTY